MSGTKALASFQAEDSEYQIEGFSPDSMAYTFILDYSNEVTCSYY